MTHPDQVRGLTFYPARLLASFIFIVALSVAYWRFSNPVGFTDWQGYETLFYSDGGYLARAGVDPLFVMTLRFCHRIFGDNGYETFRTCTFVIFLISGSWVAYSLPTYNTSPIITSTIVVSAFLIKSVVQIREGLALIFILSGLVVFFSGRRGGRVAAICSSIGGYLTHLGTALFGVTWLVAAAIHLIPQRIIKGRAFSGILLAMGILVGAVIATVVEFNATAVEFMLRDMSADVSAEAIGGFWKDAYWAVKGIIVLLLRHQLLKGVAWGEKTPYIWANVFGSAVLPAVYVFTTVLVFGQFYLPAVTTFGSRLLFTLSSVALVIIALRREANWFTFSFALFAIAEQLRLLTSASELGL
jgi:hypothetical protein